MKRLITTLIFAAAVGSAAPACASGSAVWHQQAQVVTRHCPRIGGCYYTYQDTGYVSNDGADPISNSITGEIIPGARTRTLQFAHGQVLTFSDGSTVTV